eukprot:7383497-Prymnesium_polylepis.1
MPSRKRREADRALPVDAMRLVTLQCRLARKVGCCDDAAGGRRSDAVRIVIRRVCISLVTLPQPPYRRERARQAYCEHQRPSWMDDGRILSAAQGDNCSAASITQ